MDIIFAWIPPRHRTSDKGLCAGYLFWKVILGNKNEENGKREKQPKGVSLSRQALRTGGHSVPLEATEEPPKLTSTPRSWERGCSPGSQPPLAQGCPRTTHKLPSNSRFTHAQGQLGRLLQSSHTEMEEKPEAGKIPVEQLVRGVVRLHLCTAGCHSDAWNKRAWCEKTIGEHSRSIPPELLRPEPVSDSPGGLWALIGRLHPRVSGSGDGESGLGANISSTFSVCVKALKDSCLLCRRTREG